MQTYLSKERIKAIANYLNSVLPKESIKVFRELEEKGVHFNYECGRMEAQENKNIMWRFLTNEFLKNTTPENHQQYKYLYNMGQWDYASDLVFAYINKHYKKEYAIVSNTNFYEITEKLNGVNTITQNAQLHKHIDIKTAMLYDGGFEKYLTDNFGEKSVDPKLLEETERIAKYIDSQYYGRRGEKNYARYQYAVRKYMETGDKQLLHNLLNVE